jgi:hypothetical protein
MAADKGPLEDALKYHLERYGGIVIKRVIDSLKSSYDSDAPELQSEEAFKEFLKGKDQFRISTSVNNVERVRLTNAPRTSPGFFGMVIRALEDLVRDQIALVCTPNVNFVDDTQFFVCT